ncbi:MAG: metal-sensing transcriptional repressor [Saccharofermentanales bacterium]
MKADNKQITRLLKTARGQLDGILKMVEDDRYCIDISNQLLATQAILKKVNRSIIHSHIEHCVMEAYESGDPDNQREKLTEIDNILEKLMR